MKRKGKELSTPQIAIKSFLTFSIPILLILCVVPGPSGKPIMNWNQLLPDRQTFSQAKLLLKGLLPKGSESPLYKWQDSNGKWNISKQVPEYARNTAVLETPGTIKSNSPLSFTQKEVYKWKDKRGVWHFSEELPDDATVIATKMIIQ